MEMLKLKAEIDGRLGVRSSERLGKTCPDAAERFARACPSDARTLPGTVHPLFAPSQMSWGPGPQSSDIRPDGTPPWVSLGLPLELFRVMGAGQRLTFHRAIAADADLTVETWLEAVSSKEGRSGPMLIIEVAREFLCDQELVAECRESIIVRP